MGNCGACFFVNGFEELFCFTACEEKAASGLGNLACCIRTLTFRAAIAAFPKFLK